MKTTQKWLTEIKDSPEKLQHWLQRQYVGEALAADRIAKLAEAEPRYATLLKHIAKDEATHRDWVAELLTHRGIPLPKVSYDGTRYWKPILGELKSFDELAGAGYHAEKMRLVRIEALAADPEIDADIRNTFARIERDEAFHVKAFAYMSSKEAREQTEELHKEGLEALGLTV